MIPASLGIIAVQSCLLAQIRALSIAGAASAGSERHLLATPSAAVNASGVLARSAVEAATNVVPSSEQSVVSFALREVHMLVHKLRHSVKARKQDPSSGDLIEELPDGEETMLDMFQFGCFHVVTCTIIAVLYRLFIQNSMLSLKRQIEPQQQFDNFEHNLCSTEKCSLELCVCSVCCLCLRWPTTVSNEQLGGSQGPLIGFWVAFFIYVVLDGFTGIFFGLLWCVHIGMCVYFRQQIRARYGLPSGTRGSYCEDCVTWACCCWFAVAQEAKQVESVYPPTDAKMRAVSEATSQP